MRNAIRGSGLAATEHGVYFVVPAKGVSANCPKSCEAQTDKSPNGDPPADAMVSLVAHELDEAVTDPRPWTAWWNQLATSREENADECAWKFPASHKVGNGSHSNVKLGDREYLIQANWLNAGSGAFRMHD